MPKYLVSYDLRKQRNYAALIKQLRDWGAISPLESVWLANLNGTAAAVRDVLKAHIDADDGLMVVELMSGSDWATYKVNEDAGTWLKQNVKA